MTLHRKIAVASLVAALLPTVSRPAFPAEETPPAIVIKQIDIHGLKRLEDATVRAKLKAKEGGTFSPEVLREDVRELYRLGTFEDIKAESEPFEGGIRLAFTFQERPIVREIFFTGNDKVKSDALKEQVTLKAFAALNPSAVSDSVEKIRRHYQSEGYYLARVVPVVRVISPHEVNLIFDVEEGPKVWVESVEISGNRVIDAKKIKKAMPVKEWWIFSWLDSSGTYKEEEARKSVEAVRDLYYNEGYIEANVGEPKVALSPEKTSLSVSVAVEEGGQYRVGEIKVTGTKVASEEEVRGRLIHKPGEIFRRSDLRKEIGQISDLYNERGRAFADISPQVLPDAARKVVDITYQVTEGDETKIGRIRIAGNTKTRDKVVRREFRQDEGDTFNSALLKRSHQRLMNLNFFENVEITPDRRAGTNIMDMKVKVTERPTGQFSMGAGYSSFDKLTGTISISEGNFGGRGQLLKLSAQMGSRTRLYNLTFREPWLLDRQIGGSISIYRDQTEYDSYKQLSDGVRLGVDKAFTEYVSGSLGYKFEKTNVFDVSETASPLVKEQEGRATTSAVTAGVTRDSRDNFLLPRRGSRNALSYTFAGEFLGGSNEFHKVVAGSGWYFPLPWESSFLINGKYGQGWGLNGKKLPVFERFFVGGINTVRGFRYGDAGPKDESGNRLGGTKMLVFNSEVVFPLVSEAKLMGVLFYDLGAGFNAEDPVAYDSLRHGAGWGLRWISPVGPLRLEWGYNLRPKEGERKTVFEFSIGTFF